MVSKERLENPRRTSSNEKKKVDAHGFPAQKGGGDFFSGIPSYGQDQENFDDISWDDGTITTCGTTSKPSKPKLMPISRDSFCADDNPFGYGDQGAAQFGYEDHTPSRPMRSRRASVSGSVQMSSHKRSDRRRRDEDDEGHPEEVSSRHSRYRRRASVNAGGSGDTSSSRGDRRPRRARRSSLSHVPQETPPLFTGDDILSSTTIDQGNGNRVCVVVVQLDNNGNPIDDNVLKRESDRSRRRSGSKEFEPLESAGNTLNGRESRRLSDSDRKSSEVRSGDRPRRRSSLNMASSKESSRPRRSALSQGKSMRERDEYRGESDRPRRRSSITHTDSDRSAEQKGEQSQRMRSSIRRVGSNLSGSSDRQEGSTASGNGDGENSRHERRTSRRSSSRNLSLEDKPRQLSDFKPRKQGERDSFEAKTKPRSSPKKDSRQRLRDSP